MVLLNLVNRARLLSPAFDSGGEEIDTRNRFSLGGWARAFRVVYAYYTLKTLICQAQNLKNLRFVCLHKLRSLRLSKINKVKR
jgi:hypothetical protein